MKIYINVLLWLSSVYWTQTIIEAADIRNVTSGVTWSKAKSECGSSGLEYNLTILSNLEQLQNNTFWLGLIKKEVMTPWMYPLGCYLIDQNQTKTSSKASIGLCQHQCNSTAAFGYQGSECQCMDSSDFSDDFNTDLTECYSNRSDVSMVYKVFNHTVSNGFEKKCITSFCKETRPYYFSQMCNKTDNNITVVCDDANKINRTAGEWGADYERAKKNCLLKNKLLLSPYNCPLIPGINAWTSAFREQILIETIDEIKPTTTPPIFCYSGTRKSDGTEGVNVLERNCTDMLSFFVCRSNNTEVTTSENPTQESTSSFYSSLTKTDNSYTIMTSFMRTDTSLVSDNDYTRTTPFMKTNTASEVSDNGYTRTTSLMRTDTASEVSGGQNTLTTQAGIDKTIKNSASSNTNIGSLVGGTTGGIIITVVAILIFLFFRRKRNAQMSETKMTKPPKTISNMQYDLAETILTVNTYAPQNGDILNSLQIQSTSEYSQVDVSRHSTNDDLYNISSEGDYDKLNNVSSRKNTNDTNHYGIVGHCGDDEYDTMKGALQGKRTEDLYDTNVTVYGGKSDSTYDTANSFQHRQKDRNSTYGYST